VKVWKVILATLVIFAAGVLTGGFVVKSTQPKAKPQVIAIPDRLVHTRFLERMKGELNLTPEQRGRIEQIFDESHERMRILWDLIGPEVQGEVREVREKIRNELTPEQREKFEQLMKRHKDSPRRYKPGTNTTDSGKAASADPK
jgi:Spy/CpxP family protein refolding chaperone